MRKLLTIFASIWLAVILMHVAVGIMLAMRMA